MSPQIDMKLDGNHCDPSIFLAPFFMTVLGKFWVVFLLMGVLKVIIVEDILVPQTVLKLDFFVKILSKGFKCKRSSYLNECFDISGNL